MSLTGVVHTCPGTVVGDEPGHVHALAVDGQVAHAAHELPVAHWEVLWQVGDAAQEKGPCQVQRPREAKTGSVMYEQGRGQPLQLGTGTALTVWAAITHQGHAWLSLGLGFQAHPSS